MTSNRPKAARGARALSAIDVLVTAAAFVVLFAVTALPLQERFASLLAPSPSTVASVD